VRENRLGWAMSSTEKTSTKWDLARVMTVQSEMQTSLMNMLVKRVMNHVCWRAFQCQRPCRVSRIEARVPQGKVQEDKTYDN